MQTRRLVGLLSALAIVLTASLAQASPILSIIGGVGHSEVIGDPGGTTYSNTGKPGSGVPTALGGWPTSPMPPGFDADPSFGGALGTTGWHDAYLFLSESADVTFQYLGSGDSTLVNTQFWLVGDSSPLFINQQSTSCAVSGNPPAYSCSNAVNTTEVTRFITVAPGGGFVPFFYIGALDQSGNATTLANDGTHNYDLNTGNPAFFLGVDPYLATGTFQRSGTTVFAGLTDRGEVGPGGISVDHDFQDLGVRITALPAAVVPEPGTLTLLGLGLAVAGKRLRKARKG